MKPLYVSRRLKNTDEFITWAKNAGFLEVVTPSDIHVTIAYSSEPVDTSKRKPDSKPLVINSGERKLGKLGDEGAIVLFFESSYLENSWQELLDIGASWDYEGYHPHVTITYNGDDIDLDKIKPFNKPLRFLGEVYEPLNTEWKDDVVHESLKILSFSEYLAA